MLDTAVAPRGVRDLGDVVRAALADAALWGPHARFAPARRHWALLRADDDVDVWLLTWLRGPGGLVPVRSVDGRQPEGAR